MRTFSGIQPTGRKHLGNFIGAIRQYVAYQDLGEAIYCVVDLHSTTVPYEPEQLRSFTHDTAAILLAAGIDPERSTLFRQSDVREHSELTWLLTSVTMKGELERMTQFKDKKDVVESVSVGLFTYPVLMAADILAYQTTDVPVGEDQKQHVELARDVAQRFNQRFGETFTMPAPRIPKVGARIMNLQMPEKKMSTTGQDPKGVVYVLDEGKDVLKKFKSAVTDSGSEVKRGDDKPGISNLIEIYSVAKGISMDDVEKEFEGKQYGHLKVAVGEAIVEYLRPTRERYAELRGDEKKLEAMLEHGAAKARKIASATLEVVRDRMGIGPKRATEHRP